MLRYLVMSLTLLTFGVGLAQVSAPPVSAEPLQVWVRKQDPGILTYRAIADLYEAETGQKIVISSSFTDFEDRLLRAASAGDLPDVVINDTEGRGQLIEFGLVQEIDRSQVPGSENIIDLAWEAAKGADGKYYGIPSSTQAFVLFIRSDWRKAVGRDVPTSWDDIVDLAKAFTYEDPDGNGKDDTYGWIVPASATRGYASWFWQTFLWQSGGDYMHAVGDGTFVPALDEPAAAESLDWLKDMFCESKVVQPNAINAVTADAHPVFRTGLAGMEFSGPYMIADYDNEGAPGTEAFEVVRLPAGPVDGTVMAEGENSYIMTGTDKFDQALAFAAWLTTPAGQIAGMLPPEGGEVVIRLPINKNVDTADVYQDPRWGVVEEAFNETGRYSQPVPNFTPFRLMVAETVNAALADCNSDIPMLLQALNQQVTEELDAQGALAR